MPEKLVSNIKLFAADISLFQNTKYTSAKLKNEDLNKLSYWAFYWKMSFNLEPTKQAQEVIFFPKLQILDVKLDFQGHIKNIYSKVNKTTGLLCKLHNTLPKLPLLTIHISFIRPRLDYGDIICVI